MRPIFSVPKCPSIKGLEAAYHDASKKEAKGILSSRGILECRFATDFRTPGLDETHDVR